MAILFVILFIAVVNAEALNSSNDFSIGSRSLFVARVRASTRNEHVCGEAIERTLRPRSG